MDNKALLQEYFNTLSDDKIRLYKVPLTRFVDYLEIDKISLNDLTIQNIDEYILQRKFRKLPLKFFKAYLSSFLKYCKINIDIRKVTNECNADYYFTYKELIKDIDLKILETVTPYHECVSSYNSCKAIVCLEWMGLRNKEIAELKLSDITNDGVASNGNLIPYENDKLKKFLLEYKSLNGMHILYGNRVFFKEYIDDGYYIRGLKTSNNHLQKVDNIIRRATAIGIDNRLIVESAYLYGLYQAEQSGREDVFKELSLLQISNYKQYKSKLEEYMRA